MFRFVFLYFVHFLRKNKLTSLLQGQQTVKAAILSLQLQGANFSVLFSSLTPEGAPPIEKQAQDLQKNLSFKRKSDSDPSEPLSLTPFPRKRRPETLAVSDEEKASVNIEVNILI